MRYTALTALLLFAAHPASAGDNGTGGFSFAASMFQSLGALAIVLGLIYLLTHFSKRWFKGGLGIAGNKSHIRILETRHLAPKKSLMLVEVAGEYLLLGNGGDGITLIKQIDMLEEIEVIEVLGEDGQSRGQFQEKLEKIMAGIRISHPLRLAQRSNG